MRRADFDPQVQRVDAEAEFVAHLGPARDVILADHALPQFDVLRAMQVLRERGPDIPCIVVTGSIGDEAAAGCILHGAADFLLKDLLARLGAAVAQALEQRRLRHERRHAEADLRVCGAIQDITERKRAEELLRFNRTVAILSRYNEVLACAAHELALLREVRHLLVETGGYRLAGVGFARQDVQKSIHPVAYAGFEEGCLETSNFPWADTPHGRESTGTAIRTRGSAVCRDTLTNPAFASWHNDAIRRGYASALALLLTAGDEVLRVLIIYASHPDVLDVAEVRLLIELAGNLAYGIVNLRARTRGGAEARA